MLEALTEQDALNGILYVLYCAAPIAIILLTAILVTLRSIRSQLKESRK